MVEHEGWPKVSKMQGIFVKMMVLACCLPVVKVERIMKPPAVHDPLKSDSRSLDFGFRGIFVASPQWESLCLTYGAVNEDAWTDGRCRALLHEIYQGISWSTTHQGFI